MPRYRLTAKRTFTCTDPDGDPKPYSHEFDADTDTEAVRTATLHEGGAGVVLHDRHLARIDVPEVASAVAM